MSKTNLFVKKLKNISNSINSLLEKNLNKLNYKNINYLFKNNKIILTFVALFVIFISYLLIPTFYKQSELSNELKTQLQKKLNITFKLSENITYNIFPRPHFITTETTIFDDQNEISKINKLKIFISLDNYFSLKNIKIRNITFENANFNINKKNYNFFINLLNKNYVDGNVTIKNSNIFFRNSLDEVLFINKILKMKYYYEPKELKNIFYSENEIFNLPFSMETFFNEDKSKIFSNLDSNLIKLKIENELILNNKKKIGKTDLIFNKFKKIVEYEIEKKFLKFYIFDKKDQPSKTYKGKFNLKPFYASLEGELDVINLNYLFGHNSLVVQILKTELLNNKNIDFKLIINTKNIFNNYNFRNVNLRSKIKEGLIDIDNTKFEWRNFVEFELLESLIFVKNGELVLDGKLKINVIDHKEVYKFLLTPKNYRDEIKEIDLNFTYNYDQNTVELKDIKIDNKIDADVNKILKNIILKKQYLQNKIYFKNLLNEAIKIYAG